MESRLTLDILPQPDDTTCGPTCLHAVYRYFGEELALPRVIDETQRLEEGGTLAVLRRYRRADWDVVAAVGSRRVPASANRV